MSLNPRWCLSVSSQLPVRGSPCVLRNEERLQLQRPRRAEPCVCHAWLPGRFHDSTRLRTVTQPTRVGLRNIIDGHSNEKYIVKKHCTTFEAHLNIFYRDVTQTLHVVTPAASSVPAPTWRAARLPGWSRTSRGWPMALGPMHLPAAPAADWMGRGTTSTPQVTRLRAGV